MSTIIDSLSKKVMDFEKFFYSERASTCKKVNFGRFAIEINSINYIH